MYKTTRYIILGIIICLIVQMSSNNKPDLRSLLLTSIAIVLAFVLLESVFDLFNDGSDLNKKCESVCAVQKEHFDGMTAANAETNGEEDAEVEVDAPSEDVSETQDEPKQEDVPMNKEELKPKTVTFQEQKVVNTLNNEQQKFTYAEMVNSVNDGNKLNVNETDLPYSTDDGQNYNGLDNGINYAQYQDYNHIPVPKDYTSSYEDYGYSFLPPEKWYPQPPNPPICVSDKTCPVCPVFTTGTNIELKQWDSAQEILQPDHINVKYIQDKLNKGTS